MRAYRAIEKFREGSNFRPWLLKIVMNQALTMGKSRQRRQKLSERAAAVAAAPFYGIDETV